jgi:ribonuclease HI
MGLSCKIGCAGVSLAFLIPALRKAGELWVPVGSETRIRRALTCINICILVTGGTMFNIYTDGACSGNKKGEGIGGYGYVIIDTQNKKRYTNGGSMLATTNNVMELVAAIASLKEVSRIMNYKTGNIVCEIFSDSKYLIEGWNSYLIKWLDKGWKTAKGEDVSNRKYWEILFHMACHFQFVKFDWVKGHNGNKYNEIANDLAVNLSQEKKREKRKMSEV